jgi:hypothetical protein
MPQEGAHLLYSKTTKFYIQGPDHKGKLTRGSRTTVTTKPAPELLHILKPCNPLEERVQDAVFLQSVLSL